MRNKRLGLLAAAAALALSAGAQAATSVSFSAQGDSFATFGPFNERHITLNGTGNFAADIVNGTYTLADLTDFSVTMHVAYHLAAAPVGSFVTADYQFGLSDLTALSLTFLATQPVAGAWSLTPKAPYQSSPSGFQPVLGFDVDSNVGPDQSSITFYQTIDSRKVAVMTGDFTNVSASVPEPSSWMLMVGGFGIAGAALRSRRRTTLSFA